MSNAIAKFQLSVEKNEVVILFPHETREILDELNRLKRQAANSNIQTLIARGQASIEDMD
jgi:hypothetical protein